MFSDPVTAISAIERNTKPIESNKQVFVSYISYLIRKYVLDHPRILPKCFSKLSDRDLKIGKSDDFRQLEIIYLI
jgi:hypothetical protein